MNLFTRISKEKKKEKIRYLRATLLSSFLMLLTTTIALANGGVDAIQTIDYGASINPARTGVSGICVLCGTSNESLAIDNDTTNFASMSMNVGVIATAAISIEMGTTIPGGETAGFAIQNNGLLGLIGNDILQALIINTYNNGVLQESAIGSAPGIDVGVLGTSGVNLIGFETTLPFDEIQIVLDGSLVTALTNLNIYYAFTGDTSVDAIQTNDFGAFIEGSRTGIISGLCLLCGVSNTSEVIDPDTTNFGQIDMAAGLLATGAISVGVPTELESGTEVGFALKDAGGLLGILSLDALQNITLVTYNNGVQQQAVVASSPLVDVQLLGGTGLNFLSFRTSAPFDEVQIQVTSLLSVALTLDIHFAFAIPPCPPKILNNDSAPTNTASVDENAAGAIINFDATDDFDSENNGLTYSLSGNDGALFSITADGILSFLAAPDFETPLDLDGNNVYEVLVTVTDSDGQTDEQLLSVTVNNLNDNAPVIVDQDVTIDENTANMTLVVDLEANDADGDMLQDWMIISGNIDTDNDGQLPFTIDPNTGEITVNDSDDLDYEQVISFDLGVTVSDGTNTSATETITVDLNDLNDNAPVIVDQDVTIDENTANMTLVVDLEANDADGDMLQDWMIISGNVDTDNDGQLPFAIDPNTGEITVNDSDDLDYEQVISFDLGVTVSDGTNTSATETITVDLNDLNDNAPVIVDQDVTIDENTANMTLVVDLEANDADGDMLQDWMIISGNVDTDNDGQLPFAIDPNTGEITVNDSDDLDYEQVISFDLGVTVSDGTNTSATETITVDLNDLNDNAPVIVDQDVTIDENTANMTLVVDLEANDADGDMLQDWMIISGNVDTDNDGQLPFAIDPNTGEITVNDADDLDFEQVMSFDLGVTVSDGTNTSATETITVDLNNLNDNAPVIVDQDVTIDENTANMTLVVDLEANDADGDMLQDWMIISGNIDTDNDGQLPFAIDPNTGEITVNDSDDLDYEQVISFDLGVTVSDGTNTSATETITVDLNDLNDNAPIIVDQDVTIDENTANMTLVVDLEANDADGDMLQDWMIISGNVDTDNDGQLPFAIDPNTGEITVNDADDLDFEQVMSFDLGITVSDGTNTSATETITVDLNDLNDNAPVIVDQDVTIDENTANTTLVVDLEANDADGDMLQDWMIISGNVDTDNDGQLPFAIDPNTGEITVNDADDLDYEQVISFDLGVTVSDGTNTSATETITVDLNDLNDNAPVIVDQDVTIDENTANMTLVVDLEANDADGDMLQDWMIISGNVDTDNDGQLPFAIDPNTGEITVNDADDLDFEQVISFDLGVTVSDGTNTSATETITVDLNDLNDNAPVIVDQDVTIDENTANMTLVVDLEANDADGDMLQDWMIISGNVDTDNDGQLPFAIDPNTGEITVNDADDLDFEQVMSFDLGVTVSDGTNTSATETITVDLNDLNDNAPVIVDQDVTIDENTANTTLVVDLEANDADGDMLQDWMIISGNVDTDNDGQLPFTIDPNTGEITVNDSDDLDFEQVMSFDLGVTVSDGTNTSATETITVDLNDLNDNAPVIVDQDVTIDENTANTTLVVDLEANDADGDMLQDWMIISGNIDTDNDGQLPFAIDPNTGEITVNDSDDLDFEQVMSFDLGVTVSDGTNTSATETITVDLNDLNDNAPVIVDQDVTIDENTANTTLVVDLAANDADGDMLQDWMIISGNVDIDGDGQLPFAIDPNTGEITVNDSDDLDFEQVISFDLSVSVSDGTNTSTPVTITIDLNNLNDNAPIIVDQDATVSTDAPFGTVVVDLEANDADGDMLQDWMIISGNIDIDNDGQLPFSINPATGEIAVNDSDDLDINLVSDFDLDVTVSDGVNVSATETITINLFDVTACGNAFDALQSNDYGASIVGTRTGILSGVCALCSVSNTDEVVDVDTTNFGQIDLVAGLLTTAAVSVGVPTDLPSGTGVGFAVKDAGGLLGILSADVLQNITIATYNNGVEQEAFVATNPLVEVQILGGTGLNFIGFEASSDFDEVQIRVTSLLSAALTLDVHFAYVQPLCPPTILNNASAPTNAASIDENIVSPIVDIDAIDDIDSEGSGLVYSLSGNDGALFSITADGILSFLAAPDFETPLDLDGNNVYEVLVTVTDSDGQTDEQLLSVTVNNLNDNAPVIVDQDVTIDENTANMTLVVDLEANDADGDMLQDWMIISGNVDTDNDGQLPFAIDPNTGEITVNDADDLDFEQVMSFDLGVTVSDGTNTSATETITVDLNDLNDNAPIIVDQDVTIDENTANMTLVVDLEANDADGDMLQDWMIISGNVDIDGDGQLPFAIDPNTGEITVNDADDLDYEQVISFDLGVTVSDGTNTSATETITVDLNDLNDNAPVIVDQDVTIDENTANMTLVVDLEANDADGDMLQDWMIISGNVDIDGDGQLPFAINPNTGEITVNDADDLDYEQVISFDLGVTVSDGTNTSATETITVDLNDLNDNAPVIVDQDVTIDENTANMTLVVDLEANDADGDMLQDWMIISGNVDIDGDGQLPFAINPNTGEITVNDSDDLDFEQVMSFDLGVTVSDGTNTSATETITVDLNDLNDNAPVIVDQDVTIDENTANMTLVVDLEANDADGDMLQDWMIISGNIDTDNDGQLPFAIDPNTGEITVNDSDDLDFEQVMSFDLGVTVSDGTNTSAPETITINLNNLNDNAPVIVDQDVMINEGLPNTSLVVDLVANDADGDMLQDWMIISGNVDIDGDGQLPFAIDPNTGEITVNDSDDLNFEQVTSFDLGVTVSDGENTSAVETITIDLIDVNDNAPVIVDVSPNVDENSGNGTLVVDLEAVDPDGDPVMDWMIVGGNMDVDGDGTPPFAIDPLTGEVTVLDSDDLDFEQVSSVDIVVTVSDGVNTSAPETITINLNNLNDNAPVIVDQDVMINEGLPNTSLVVDLAANDADGDMLQDWMIISGNVDIDGDGQLPFAIDPNTGEITVNDSDDLNFEQVTSFDLGVTVSDGANTSAVETITIDLIDVNDNAPVIVDVSPNVDENSGNGTLVVDLEAVDPDGDPVMDWMIVGGNMDVDGDGTPPFAIDPVTGEVTVLDSDDLDFEQVSSVDIVVTVSDGVNTSAPETITINLNNLNDNAPVIVDQDVMINEGLPNTSLVVDLAANDADGDMLQDWMIISGNVDIDGDGQLPFSIDPNTGEITVNDSDDLNFEQVTSFDLGVTVSDGANTSAVETITIDLIDVNDNAPVIVDVTPNVDENSGNGTLVVDLEAVDPDGDPVMDWMIVGGNMDVDGDGTPPFAIDPVTGEVTVLDSDDLDFEQVSSVDIVVTVSDGVNTSAPETITINLNNLNDNTPVIVDQDVMINEGLPNTSLVVDLAANDADGDMLQDWMIISGNVDIDGDGQLPFSIDPNTGEITVNDADDLDFEQITNFDLGVTVSDGANTSAVEIITIDLIDVNENNNAPVIVDVTPNVDENSANGTLVVDLEGFDLDGDDLMDWMIIGGNMDIDGDGIPPFVIDPVTGEVTVLDSDDLDFEQVSSIDIVVTVSDGVNTSAPVTITINLNNLNDNAPVIVDQDVSIEENTPDGTSVVDLAANDADGDMLQDWMIISGNVDIDGDGQLPFAIDPNTGEITVNDADDLDFEQVTSFDLGVTVSDGANTSAVEIITIDLIDVNENNNAPVIVDVTPNVDENSANGTLVVDLEGFDLDGDDLMDWMIIGGNMDIDGDGIPPFVIDPITGEVTVLDSDDLDFEQVSSIDIVVTVSDGVNTSAPVTITINLNNLNDNAPVIIDQDVMINEGLPNTSLVVDLAANDADGDMLQDWMIISGNVDIDGDGQLPFAIDPNTGEITVNDADDLDFEQVTSFDLGVTVSDGANTSAVEIITIDLIDVNENNNAPVIVDVTPNVDENSANGTLVVDLEGFDLDGDDLMDWMIIGGNMDIDGDGIPPFVIDPLTGEVTVLDSDDLDFEQVSSIDIVVTVSDGVNTSAPETITINLNNLNDNAPVIVDQDVSIEENTPDGTSVVDLAANDADGDMLQDWMIISGNVDIDGDGQLPFAIDPNTGEITVNDADDLDFEQVTSFDLGVTVSDGANTSAVEIITIDLIDVNENNNAPVIVDVTPNVDENSANGTLVVDLEGFDLDGDDLMDWMIIGGNMDIDGDGTPPFVIDPLTGEVTVLDSDDLDFEQVSSIDIVVTVSDGVNTSAPVTITINLNNLNDNAPVIVDQDVSIEENTPDGTSVVDLAANDADGDMLQDWMIISGNVDIDGDGQLPFAIDPNTGEITVNDADDLDFEQITSFDLGVTVSDGANTSAVETITIDLIDVNENNNVPIIVDVTPTIDENTPNGTLVVDLEGIDLDGDNLFNWMIIGGNLDVDGDGIPPFIIDDESGEVIVWDSGDLDFEQVTSIDIVVTVSDGVNTSAPVTITINLNNLNDNAPVVDDQIVSVQEGILIGTSVTTATATDADGDPLQDWMIVSGNTDVDGDGQLPFIIDPLTGEITVNDSDDLDFEQIMNFNLGVTVSDGLFTSNTGTITINLIDVIENPNAPVIVDVTPSIDENSPNGTPVVDLEAIDPDGDPVMDWTIIGGNVDIDGDGIPPFAIDPNTGEVTVLDSDDLDYEQVTSISIVVTVSDGTNTSAPETITININNLNDNAPAVMEVTVGVDENAPESTSIITLTANDADGDILSNWMIVGGNIDLDNDGFPAVIINPLTGELVVFDSDDLDFEQLTSFDIMVTVSDGLNTSAPATITIIINDLVENQNAPVVTDVTPDVDENSPNGTFIVDLAAVDPDGNPVFDWMIVGGNLDIDGNGIAPFTIDPATGVVTVLDGGDLDYEQVTSIDIVVTVSDGTNTSAPTTITILINDVNEPPVINNVDVTIDENTPDDTFVVEMTVDDPENGMLDDWMIVAGNMDIDGDGELPFTIDPMTGVITVNDSGDLDFEMVNCFQLMISVNDEMTTYIGGMANICLNNLNDNPPVVIDNDVTIPENSANGTLAVDVEAIDADGDMLQDWMITGGNVDVDGNGIAPFMIDPNTGEITVTDSGDLDFEMTQCFDLQVTVSDGVFTSAEETITVCLENDTTEDEDGDDVIEEDDPDDNNPCVPNPNHPNCTGNNQLIVQARVFLMGPYNPDTDLMGDDLRALGLIPMEDPYTPSGDFTTVPSGMSQAVMDDDAMLVTAASDAIVDWVFLELRSAFDSTEVVATQAALVQRDGDVVTTDGVSSVVFDIPADEYYLVIRHRNHLGVMTADAVELQNGNQAIVDFTDPATPTWGDFAQGEIEPGVMGLWAGNAKLDDQVIFQGDFNDLADVFFEVLTAPNNFSTEITYIFDGYNQGDLNMDGRTIYQGPSNDLSMPFLTVLQHPGNALMVVTYIVQEQLPE